MLSANSPRVVFSLGVCLLAVLDSTDSEPCLKLNPGPDYILKGTDYCFYMSLTKEEYSRVTTPLEHEDTSPMSQQRQKNIGTCFTFTLRFWFQFLKLPVYIIGTDCNVHICTGEYQCSQWVFSVYEVRTLKRVKAMII